MITEQLSLSYFSVEEIFSKLNQFPNKQYDYQKHRILLQDENNEVIAYLRLPLSIAVNPNFSIEIEQTYFYLSIEAGNAAVALFRGEELLDHTTFSAYMVRKKQGVSQIKHLKTKGKSRAGSRIRLSETEEFFENINAKINEFNEDYLLDRIALSCSKTLLPYFYRSDVKPFFQKEDKRIYSIPIHLPQSNFSNLMAMHEKLKPINLFYQPDFDVVKSIFMNP